jgi:hypothetical protein
LDKNEEVAGMAKKRKIRPIETYDAFYCTIDGWRREYHFGIKYPEFRRDRNGRRFNEWDHVEIVGKVRHHDRGCTSHRRPFETVEVWLFWIHAPRNEWEKDPKDIGSTMQASDGMLRVPRYRNGAPNIFLGQQSNATPFSPVLIGFQLV